MAQLMSDVDRIKKDSIKYKGMQCTHVRKDDQKAKEPPRIMKGLNTHQISDSGCVIDTLDLNSEFGTNGSMALSRKI